MGEGYTVEQGDCISSIAYENGFFWKTLWDHPDNAELKQTRKNPNILLGGDVVHIPDLTVKEESGTTEKKHKFKLKGVPALLRLWLREEAPPQPPQQGGGQQQPQQDTPRANVPYVLYIDDVLKKQGNTDANGCLTASIPPNAKGGRLVLAPGSDKESTFILDLGFLDPIEEVSGVQQRLMNLGFDCGGDEDTLGEGTKQALKAFQVKAGLTPTGELDDATRNKLRAVHDGA